MSTLAFPFPWVRWRSRCDVAAAVTKLTAAAAAETPQPLSMDGTRDGPIYAGRVGIATGTTAAGGAAAGASGAADAYLAANAAAAAAADDDVDE